MDILEDECIVIESVRMDGRKFRPSDWIERIATMLATFGPDHRLHYADNVQPCMINGEKCLVIGRALEQQNPGAYRFIMQFAVDNNLSVLMERRQQDVAVTEERRSLPPTAA